MKSVSKIIFTAALTFTIAHTSYSQVNDERTQLCTGQLLEKGNKLRNAEEKANNAFKESNDLWLPAAQEAIKSRRDQCEKYALKKHPYPKKRKSCGWDEWRDPGSRDLCDKEVWKYGRRIYDVDVKRQSFIEKCMYHYREAQRVSIIKAEQEWQSALGPFNSMVATCDINCNRLKALISELEDSNKPEDDDDLEILNYISGKVNRKGICTTRAYDSYLLFITTSPFRWSEPFASNIEQFKYEAFIKYYNELIQGRVSLNYTELKEAEGRLINTINELVENQRFRNADHDFAKTAEQLKDHRQVYKSVKKDLESYDKDRRDCISYVCRAGVDRSNKNNKRLIKYTKVQIKKLTDLDRKFNNESSIHRKIKSDLQLRLEDIKKQIGDLETNTN